MSESYAGRKLSVTFDGARCIHARHCVTRLPSVFLANTDGAWIQPDNAAAHELIAVIESCPSGALSYTATDADLAEAPPERNLIRVSENGPLQVRARLVLDGAPHPTHRVTLCRCGDSQNKPYCDGSHKAKKFTASGEPAPAAELGEPPGADTLTITPSANGPLLVNGPVELLSGTGACIARTSKCALCRCGHSGNKPYCDGTHKKVGFQA
jgi:CDGSH-type Zn-finger protein/uncharacterized Fe-S cluster protein YjdI